MFFQNCYAMETLDTAIEASSIRMEYISSSKRGLIYPKDCPQCKQAFYEFSQEPIIIKAGKEILFSNFLTDYWNAKYTTLLLDKETKTVLTVIY